MFVSKRLLNKELMNEASFLLHSMNSTIWDNIYTFLIQVLAGLKYAWFFFLSSSNSLGYVYVISLFADSGFEKFPNFQNVFITSKISAHCTSSVIYMCWAAGMWEAWCTLSQLRSYKAAFRFLISPFIQKSVFYMTSLVPCFSHVDAFCWWFFYLKYPPNIVLNCRFVFLVTTGLYVLYR